MSNGGEQVIPAANLDAYLQPGVAGQVDVLQEAIEPEVSIGPAESVAVESTSVLESGVNTIPEDAARLLKLAELTAKKDYLEAQAYRANPAAQVSMIIGTALAPYPQILTGQTPGIVATLGVAGGIASFGHWAYAHTVSGFESRRPIVQEDGYTLQCLRITDSTMLPDGKAAVAIHPRYYDGTEGLEPPVLTKERLAQALDTVANAVEMDTSDTIGSIIIPKHTAEAAGLPIRDKKLYADILAAQIPDGIHRHVSYYPSQEVLIVPPHMAKQFADIARKQPGTKDALLQRVFSDLATRFPGKADMLEAPDLGPLEGNKAILQHQATLKTLNGLLERSLGDEGGMRTKVRTQTPILAYKAETKEDKTVVRSTTQTAVMGWDGTTQRVSEGVSSTIIGDPYNPIIQTRGTVTRQEDRATTLDALTGGDQLDDDIVGKLNFGHYDNIQLIRVALKLLEQKKLDIETDAVAKARNVLKGDAKAGAQYTADHDATSGKAASVESDKPLPRGVPGGIIEFKGVHRGYKARMIGRFALRVTLTAGMLAGAYTAYDAVHDADKSKTAVTEVRHEHPLKETLWRVEDHGLDEKSAYWGQSTAYNLDGHATWYTMHSDNRMEPVGIPRQLAATVTKYDTVSRLLKDDETFLPVQDGTQVAALRATSASGVALPVYTYKAKDGRMAVRVDTDGQDDYYRLEYDLTGADAATIRPSRTPTIQDADTLSYAGYTPKKDSWPSEDSPIQNNFTYDNSDQLKQRLAGMTTKEFTDYLQSQQRCQCLQCNTLAATRIAKDYPDAQMAMVTGYHHSAAKDEHFYLTDPDAHAWLDVRIPYQNTHKLGIIDATATKTDANSNAPVSKPTNELDGVWKQQAQEYVAQTQPEHPEEPWRKALLPLAMIALLGTAGLEIRKKYMQQVVAQAYHEGRQLDSWLTAAADIDPRRAVQLMKWHVHGKDHYDTMPQAPAHDDYRDTSPDTIADETLVEIASGGFRGAVDPKQRAGLENTARALLRERRLAAHKTGAKHIAPAVAAPPKLNYSAKHSARKK